MKFIRNIGLSFLFLFATIYAFESVNEKQEINFSTKNEVIAEHRKSIFIGMLIESNDSSIESFLNSIEKLDYDKHQIQIQLNICNPAESVKTIVMNWIGKNKNHYRDLIFFDSTPLLEGKDFYIDRNKISAEIKNAYLAECKNRQCEYCLILSSNVFIAPNMLNDLIQKDKPIIAPLLRPISDPYDSYRNFFYDIDQQGYYKDHADYLPIANRHKRGTFKVPCVHGIYLIQFPYLDKLSFSDNLVDYEFISFSKNARINNIRLLA